VGGHDTLSSPEFVIAENSGVMNLDEMNSFLVGSLGREHKARGVTLYTPRKKMITICGQSPIAWQEVSFFSLHMTGSMSREHKARVLTAILSFT
jgi:hypothetical protein